jgi:carbamate kinase
MGPKIQSALRFLKQGGHEVIITSYEHLYRAVQGLAGTHLLPDSASDRVRQLRRHEEVPVHV